MFHLRTHHLSTIYTWRLGKGGIKTGVIDECVGHQEEVRYQWGNVVQLPWSKIVTNISYQGLAIPV